MSECDCGTVESECQTFPRTGKLSAQKDWNLKRLRERLGSDDAIVYSYVIDTIKLGDGHFVQTGSGPNFQGEMITLCTCKRYMRTFLDNEDWVGKWIAGFTGLEAGSRRNALVYLMKVGQAYGSFYDLWTSDNIPIETKIAKAADRQKCGDLYRPIDYPTDPHDYRSYIPPVSGHVHEHDAEWHKDINTYGCSGRRPALLVGDPAISFLWECPKIYRETRLHRGQKKDTLKELLAELRMYA